MTCGLPASRSLAPMPPPSRATSSSFTTLMKAVPGETPVMTCKHGAQLIPGSPPAILSDLCLVLKGADFKSDTHTTQLVELGWGLTSCWEGSGGVRAVAVCRCLGCWEGVRYVSALLCVQDQVSKAVAVCCCRGCMTDVGDIGGRRICTEAQHRRATQTDAYNVGVWE